MVNGKQRHNKYCAEIYGFPPTNKSDKAEYYRKNLICPFRPGKTECDPDNKVSNLTDSDGNKLVKAQTGACTAWNNPRWSEDPYPVIICPYRFLEENKLFRLIRDEFLDAPKIKIIHEFGLTKNLGTVDGLIVELEAQNTGSNNMGRLIHLEYQSDATTGTRGLIQSIRDFNNGIDITKNDYTTYGLNSKASIKGASIQMFQKSYYFSGLGIPSVWVMQDYLFEYMQRIYPFERREVGLQNFDYDNAIFFVTMELEEGKHKFDLRIGSIYKTTPKEIQNSINRGGENNDINLLYDKIKHSYSSQDYIIF